MRIFTQLGDEWKINYLIKANKLINHVIDTTSHPLLYCLSILCIYHFLEKYDSYLDRIKLYSIRFWFFYGMNAYWFVYLLTHSEFSQ